MRLITNEEVMVVAGGQVGSSDTRQLEVGATHDNGTGYTGSYTNPTGVSFDYKKDAIDPINFTTPVGAAIQIVKEAVLSAIEAIGKNMPVITTPSMPL